MKKTVIIIVLVLGFAGLTNAQPQRGQGKMDPEKAIERISEALSLDDQQKEHFEILFTEFRTEAEEVRDDENLDRSQKQEKMELLREEHQNNLKQILNEEQIALMEEHIAERGTRGPGSKEKGMRQNRPNDKTIAALKEKRIEFDSNLSDDEKATIEDVRAQLDEFRSECDNSSKENKRDRSQKKQHFEEVREITAPVMEIAEEHNDEIADLLADVRTEKPEYADNERQRKGKGKRSAKGEKSMDHKMMKSTRFLLMDVSDTETTGSIENMEGFNIYPNPAADDINIEFTTNSEEVITIELVNKYGNTLEQIDDTFRAEGTHNINYDVSNLPSREVYFIRVSKPDEVLVEKFIKL